MPPSKPDIKKRYEATDENESDTTDSNEGYGTSAANPAPSSKYPRTDDRYDRAPPPQSARDASPYTVNHRDPYTVSYSTHGSINKDNVAYAPYPTAYPTASAPKGNSHDTTVYSVPSGDFKYADMPKTFSYSRTPQIKNPTTWHPEDEEIEKMKRKEKYDRDWAGEDLGLDHHHDDMGKKKGSQDYHYDDDYSRQESQSTQRSRGRDKYDHHDSRVQFFEDDKKTTGTNQDLPSSLLSREEIEEIRNQVKRESAAKDRGVRSSHDELSDYRNPRSSHDEFDHSKPGKRTDRKPDDRYPYPSRPDDMSSHRPERGIDDRSSYPPPLQERLPYKPDRTILDRSPNPQRLDDRPPHHPRPHDRSPYPPSSARPDDRPPYPARPDDRPPYPARPDDRSPYPTRYDDRSPHPPRPEQYHNTSESEEDNDHDRHYSKSSQKSARIPPYAGDSSLAAPSSSALGGSSSRRNSRVIEFDDEHRSSQPRESTRDITANRLGVLNLLDPRAPSPNRSQTRHMSLDPRAPSPHSQMRNRMSSLSVSGERPRIPPGGAPPASPLLEPYRGTWQAMANLPSPMMRPIDADYSDISDQDLDAPSHPLARKMLTDGKSSQSGFDIVQFDDQSDDDKKKKKSHKVSSKRGESPERKKSKPKKTVSMYEAELDAKDIAHELIKARPNPQVLTEILPVLSHDEIIELQLAYKRVVVKNGQGVKLSNHIRTKLLRGIFNTLAYVTALGRWESEGYWANYWYQGDTSKRELLIESLMGRKNAEVKFIKESFKDKRYANSLIRCMDKELRRDKFRTAVLMVLDESRQEESDVKPIDAIQKDVDIWVKALRGREGGETAMLEVCILRSDRHLSECLQLYRKQEGRNFAREVLKRSSNLVGEVIAHVLNGVINKPARDAMLLHHAVSDLNSEATLGDKVDKDPNPRTSSSKISLNPWAGMEEKRKEVLDRKNRYELLTSRLVRLHWDPMHMARVKTEYERTYKISPEQDVEEFLTGDFQEFCLGLLGGRKERGDRKDRGDDVIVKAQYTADRR